MWWGSSGNEVDESSSEELNTIVAGETTTIVDSSIPFTKQVINLFSTLQPNSQFYNVKIKEISHPKKFVGQWSMWHKHIGKIDRLNADGSCEEITYNYKTGKYQDSGCLKWYHITLEEKSRPLLVVVYKSDICTISYEWSDKDNLLLTYDIGDGALATRVNSNKYAKSIEERALFGIWVANRDNLRVFWGFDANHKFYIKSYRRSDNRLVFSREGKWYMNKTDVTFFLNRNSLDSYAQKSLPPQHLTINFSKGIEALGYQKFYRYSEPIMINQDPYVGTFQAHSTYHSRSAISLSITQLSSNNYSVDLYWNNEYYPQNSAKRVNGNLHVDTEFGTMIFKPVVNGIQKINHFTNNSFDFPERILRVSQKALREPKSIVGSWVQSVHYSKPEKYRYFIFLKNGYYFHVNRAYGSKISSEGRFGIKENKLYFMPLCGERKVEDIEWNRAHLNLGFYGTAVFVKINESQVGSSFLSAIKNFELDYQKSKIRLVPHPRYQGKFLFAKEMKYENVGFLGMKFKPDGEMFSYYWGNQYVSIRSIILNVKMG